MKITNIQHCIEKNDEIDYAQYINKQHNVKILFNEKNDESDELTIIGNDDNVKNAMNEMFDGDDEQIEMYM